LHRISIEELLLWKGIGPAKAVKIKAALELGKRIQGLPAQKKKLVAPAVRWLMTLCFL
jgi:DNA repair protein RadC